MGSARGAASAGGGSLRQSHQDSVVKGRKLFRDTRLASPRLNDMRPFELPGELGAEFERS